MAEVSLTRGLINLLKPKRISPNTSCLLVVAKMLEIVLNSLIDMSYLIALVLVGKYFI